MRRVITWRDNIESSVTSWVSGSLIFPSVNQSTAGTRASLRMVKPRDLITTLVTQLSTLAMKASHLTVREAKHVRQTEAGQEDGLSV